MIGAQDRGSIAWASVAEAIGELRTGRPVIVVDDPDREHEGDLVLAAEFASPERLAFFIREAMGLVCVAMAGSRLDELRVPPMAGRNTSHQGTPFCVGVEIASASTGVSAADRAATIQALIDPATRPGDLLRPGHVFPLRAAEGGLAERRGHTEASVELCRRAGLYPAAVLAEVMNRDGTMARGGQLAAFAARHRLKVVAIASLVGEPAPQGGGAPRRGAVVLASSELPTAHGMFRLLAFGAEDDRRSDLALILGRPAERQPPLVRIHSECFTGDVLGSQRCDCAAQLHRSLELIAAEGCGVLLYLRQEGRGIGLVNKIRAYALQDEGLDTVAANLALGYEPDLREYSSAGAILRDLGIERIRLLTNNPAKVAGVEAEGIAVTRLPLETPAHGGNRAYLEAKRQGLGHLLELP